MAGSSIPLPSRRRGKTAPLDVDPAESNPQEAGLKARDITAI